MPTIASRPMVEAVDAFILQKQVGGCSARTIETYRYWLDPLARAIPDTGTLESVALTGFFAALRARERPLSRVTIHQGYGHVKAFVRWLLATTMLRRDPFAGFVIRAPRTLPNVPTDDEVTAVVRACPATSEGTRNRAMLLVMADAGLRASEVLHLLVRDWQRADAALFVREGKGKKDRIARLNPTTIRAIRAWIAVHPQPAGENWLFCDVKGKPLNRRNLVQILHRLSARAGLGRDRRLHPHALRHYAATSWLRNGVGLDEVRRLLGHSTLSTTLRYSNLVDADLARAHRQAAAIERLRLG